jgi:hypothetical protein
VVADADLESHAFRTARGLHRLACLPVEAYEEWYRHLEAKSGTDCDPDYYKRAGKAFALRWRKRIARLECELQTPRREQ